MAEKDNLKFEDLDKGPTIGMRHVQVMFNAVFCFMMCATRFGFSVSLIAMLEPSSPNPDIPVYNWNNKGILLSTFFWGYVIPQFPIGIIGTKFGTHKIILVVLTINCIASILIPTMADKFGLEGVVICRVIQGLSQGMTIPCLHGMLGKWAPTHERTRMYGLQSTGYTLGIITGLSTTGYLCSSWAGWPVTFYLLPSLTLVFVVLFYFYGASSPATHKNITEAERRYIESSLESQNIHNVSIPFKAIITSVPFLSTITMALCSGWGFSILTTVLPIYMSKVMKFSIKSNGMLSSLPHVCTLCMGILAACLADYLISRKILSVGTTRKTMSSIGSIGCATLFLLLAFMPTSNRAVSILVIAFTNTFRSLNLGGYCVNHLDLGPNFGSTLMGITNTASEMFSLITPIAVQYIVYDESDQFLWRRVFLTAVAFYVFSTIIFLSFASGERQWWNYVKVVPKDEEQPLSNDKKQPENLVKC